MKIAILQRILPDFRYDLFKLLNENSEFKYRLFFGAGQRAGAARNTKRNYSTFGTKLFTIPFLKKKYRVIHPTLFIHLVLYKPDVIIVEPSTYFPNNFLAFIYAKIVNKKIIWWEAGLVEKMSLMRRIIEVFVRIMIKYSNAYIAYSTIAKKRLIDEYCVKHEKIFVAQNAIYNNYINNQAIETSIKASLQINKNDIVLCYIGSVEKRKKIELIINILTSKKNKRLHLMIIGDGDDLEFYKSIVQNSKIEQIYFLGRKERTEANPYLSIADFTILPAEGGLAINHSLSVGTPVICGRNDGTEKDLIYEGINGIIVSDFSPESVSKVLFDSNFNDEKIKRHYMQNFDINNMIKSINNSVRYIK